MTAVGVYQSKRLPNHDKRGDSDWRGRVISLQAAVPGVDRKGRDAGSGQNAHTRESGYVKKHTQKQTKSINKHIFFNNDQIYLL